MADLVDGWEKFQRERLDSLAARLPVLMRGWVCERPPESSKLPAMGLVREDGRRISLIFVTPKKNEPPFVLIQGHYPAGTVASRYSVTVPANQPAVVFAREIGRLMFEYTREFYYRTRSPGWSARVEVYLANIDRACARLREMSTLHSGLGR